MFLFPRVTINTIELTLRTSCYCVVDLLCDTGTEAYNKSDFASFSTTFSATLIKSFVIRKISCGLCLLRRQFVTFYPVQDVTDGRPGKNKFTGKCYLLTGSCFC